MKFMEKAKRFFTLKRRANDGFTLVELIVVIAILAILAGVAVPAYSGYIKKAEKAGDMQLLGAVNEAFQAACMAEGTDVYSISGATLTWSDKKVTGVATVDGAANDGINKAFQLFYQGNEDTAFKVITNLYFDPALHVFVDPASVSELNISYGGGKITVTKEQYDAIAGTTFVTNENLGVDGTLDKVGSVSAFAAGLFGSDPDENGESTFTKIAASEDFQRDLARYMGIPNADTMPADQLATAIGQHSENMGWDTDTQSTMAANALIMYAADSAGTKLDKNSVTSLLTGEDPHKAILESMSVENDPGKAMAQAAMAYGLYTAYAYQSGDASLIAKADAENPTDVLLELDDPDFQAWVKKEGQKDIDGYIAALDVIGQGATDSSVANDVLMNGFDNEQLKGLLGSLMG